MVKVHKVIEKKNGGVFESFYEGKDEGHDLLQKKVQVQDKL